MISYKQVQVSRINAVLEFVRQREQHDHL